MPGIIEQGPERGAAIAQSARKRAARDTKSACCSIRRKLPACDERLDDPQDPHFGWFVHAVCMSSHIVGQHCVEVRVRRRDRRGEPSRIEGDFAGCGTEADRGAEERPEQGQVAGPVKCKRDLQQDFTTQCLDGRNRDRLRRVRPDSEQVVFAGDQHQGAAIQQQRQDHRTQDCTCGQMTQGTFLGMFDSKHGSPRRGSVPCTKAQRTTTPCSVPQAHVPSQDPPSTAQSPSAGHGV